MTPYTIVREGALHKVISTHTGLPQFSSLKRSNCRDWIKANTTEET